MSYTSKCGVTNAAIVAPFAPDNDESPSDNSAAGEGNEQTAIAAGISNASVGYFLGPRTSHSRNLHNIKGEDRRLDQRPDEETDDSKATVRERNATMLFSEKIADVWFVVGAPYSERIPAHSYVLATGSSVFYAMFYGGFEKSDDIHVPDVEATAFRVMLKYLYTDEVDLDADTVLATLYAAKKYLVKHLIKACIDFLESTLTARNVCVLLSQSRLFEDEDLMQKCWEVVDAQAELALKSEGFIDLDIQTLIHIFRRETLNVRSDLSVFDAALRWAAAECDRRSLEQSPENCRKLLEPVFYEIRMTTLPVAEFANGPAQSGLLDPREIADVFLHLFAHVKPTLRYVEAPRSGLKLQHCHRFQSSAYRSNQWRYRGRCDSIQFSTDRRIFVAGFGLYGSSNGSSEYKVNIELKKGSECLATINSRFICDGSSSIFPVFFNEPVQIEPDVFYAASAILEGSELSYFGQEGMPEVCVGRVTFQFQCSTESTNGTGVQGGQLPEVLFYGGN